MKNNILILSMVTFLFSCSENKTKGNNNKNDYKKYDCLETYASDYSKLLSLEDMEKVYAFNPEVADNNLRSGDYGEHSYSWESDRPPFYIEVSNIKMEVPDNNILGIKNFSYQTSDISIETKKSNFDQGYKELSKEEIEEIEINISKSNDNIRESGKEFMEIRKGMRWQYVDNLGTSAWYKWDDNYGGELVVLAGNAKFTILCKVDSNSEKNMNIAIDLAQKVLEKCN